MSNIASTCIATKSCRVRASPSRTAKVIFPAALSPGMSRRLLITSSAVAHNPTTAPAPTARALGSSVST